MSLRPAPTDLADVREPSRPRGNEVSARMARVEATKKGWRPACSCGWVGRNQPLNERWLAERERAAHRATHKEKP